MTYKVVKDFIDLKDSGFRYSAGDTYPRPGFTTSETRLLELSTARNRRGIPLIEKVKEPVKKPARRKAKNERDSLD